MVECASLENWYTCKGIESSNLSPSAKPFSSIIYRLFTVVALCLVTRLTNNVTNNVNYIIYINELHIYQ